MTQGYDWWRKALSGVKVGGSDLPVHEGEPKPGFYRKRTSRGGTFVPVAIWQEGTEMVALVNGEEIAAVEVWTYCCRYPVEEGWYRAKMMGHPWPDEDAAIGNLAHDQKNAVELSPIEDLRRQIDDFLEAAKNYAEIKDDQDASKAQGVRSKLLELSGKADKKRTEEKAPHLKAGQEVDAAWNPLVTAAKGGADALKRAMSAFETAQHNARAAAAKVAAEAAAKVAEENPAQVAPQETPQPPPPKTQVRGGFGRAATKKMVKKVTGVTEETVRYFFTAKDPAIIELTTKLAQKAVDAGFAVPGATVEEIVDVR